MTDIKARNKANKRKGAAFEIDLLNYLRERQLTVERSTKAGINDEGDLSIRAGDLALVVEAKNEKAMNLSGYMAEATREALQWEARRVHDPNQPQLVVGVAAVKRRNQPIDKTYIIMEAGDLAEILIHLSRR